MYHQIIESWIGSFKNLYEPHFPMNITNITLKSWDSVAVGRMDGW